MTHKVTVRMKALRAAYLGDARGDKGAACKLAGYSIPAGCSPSQPWNVLKRRNPAWIAALEEEFNTSMIMKGREIDERLAALARNPDHRDHYKALELLAKMSGKLKEQLIVVDRRTLNSELDALIGVMREQRLAVEVPLSSSN
jgi:hypothetical protein